MERKDWFKRKFGQFDDNGTLPGIIERLSGTPVRLAFKIKNIDPEKLMLKPHGKWSIKEEIGHLLDLESLWSERLDDFFNGKSELRSADLENQKTHKANHNERTADGLLADFKIEREKLIEKIYQIEKVGKLNQTALHPRLKTPMKVIDLAYFIAEHDDHHLAQITRLAN